MVRVVEGQWDLVLPSQTLKEPLVHLLALVQLYPVNTALLYPLKLKITEKYNLDNSFNFDIHFLMIQLINLKSCPDLTHPWTQSSLFLLFEIAVRFPCLLLVAFKLNLCPIKLLEIYLSLVIYKWFQSNFYEL